MKDQTLYELQFYYGELMQELQTSHDWTIKRRIEKKMKAIDCLLNIDFVA